MRQWPRGHRYGRCSGRSATESAFQDQNAFGRSGFPFTSKEYTNPQSVDYSAVEVPNARWHETRTFTCFGFPTFTEDDMEQIANALVKVIQSFSK